MRSLLAHVSGMQSEPVGPWWERSPGVSVSDLLAANDGSGRVFAPGERYHYSNLGYGLLGEIVARLRGQSWADLVQDRVLDPLKMSRTSYLPQAPYAEGRSVHHLRGTLTSEPAHDTAAMAPAGQLWSTIEDLGAFAVFLAHGNPDVLGEETLAEMRRPAEPATDYGLGMRLVPWQRGLLAGHTGTMPGFQATLLVDALNKVGLVALTNATTGFDGPELALAMLGDHTPGPVEPWVPTREVPAWAEELLGFWYWGNTAMEARWQNERLELRDLSCGGLLEEQLEWREDRIVGVAGYHAGETLHVVRREQGRPVQMECATFVYTREPYPDGA